MAEKFKISVTGDEDLKQMLAEMEADFGVKTTSRILINAVRDSLAPALSRAKLLTPKDTGALAASLRIEARKPTRRDKRSVYVNETDTVISTITTAPPSKFKKGVKVYDYEESYKKKKNIYKTIEAPDDARNIAMEFGTAKVPAKPYLRPALETTATQVISILADKIKARISKYRSKNTKG